MSSTSPMKSATRRVLGEKTPNASLSPVKHNKYVSVDSIAVGKKEDLREMSTPAVSLSPPPRVLAGQKRTIDQVDVAPEDTQQLRAEEASRSRRQSQVSTGSIRREDEFYIYDESTQSSREGLDKVSPFPESSLHPIPVSTSNSPTEVQREHHNKGSSALHQSQNSMSSLLNLSFDSSDIKTVQVSRPTRVKTKVIKPHSSVPRDPQARQLFIQQKANLLKSRLQSAMKSIKDHQIDKRLSELEAHSRERPIIPSLPMATIKRARESDDSSDQTNPLHDVDLTPKAKMPKLLPAPILHPFPAAHRYSTSVNPTQTTSAMVIPSSPPASNDSQDENADEIEEYDSTTPKQSSHDKTSFPQPRTPPLTATVQLSSPPRTGDSSARVINHNPNCSVERMIAQVNKQGQAVDGLLKLMKTSREYDALDLWEG
ncbi:hypothetical protein AJ80_03983 [Polytolypa hystricis UAMH7299]|uniref:Uncharacterized protein n=1 Tax=Polytolypa hystricis (strain UAMH7299) TaxID=1447883 RepID=A0A2B7YE78_POLH7|nr:hypothetical protein AJ80_03983 [Polytolypa hystricis UAMH7299]